MRIKTEEIPSRGTFIFPAIIATCISIWNDIKRKYQWLARRCATRAKPSPVSIPKKVKICLERMIPLIIKKIVQINMPQLMTVCNTRRPLYWPRKIAPYDLRSFAFVEVINLLACASDAYHRLFRTTCTAHKTKSVTPRISCTMSAGNKYAPPIRII